MRVRIIASLKHIRRVGCNNLKSRCQIRNIKNKQSYWVPNELLQEYPSTTTSLSPNRAPTFPKPSPSYITATHNQCYLNLVKKSRSTQLVNEHTKKFGESNLPSTAARTFHAAAQLLSCVPYHPITTHTSTPPERAPNIDQSSRRDISIW